MNVTSIFRASFQTLFELQMTRTWWKITKLNCTLRIELKYLYLKFSWEKLTETCKSKNLLRLNASRLQFRCFCKRSSPSTKTSRLTGKEQYARVVVHIVIQDEYTCNHETVFRRAFSFDRAHDDSRWTKPGDFVCLYTRYVQSSYN